MTLSNSNWDDNVASWDDLTATWDGVPIAIGGYGISKEGQLPLVSERGEKTAKVTAPAIVNLRVKDY